MTDRDRKLLLAIVLVGMVVVASGKVATETQGMHRRARTLVRPPRRRAAPHRAPPPPAPHDDSTPPAPDDDAGDDDAGDDDA